ncbi:MAG: DUF86 domain-containing protein [Promethearchaeota archaeon]|nr:MAG: DUF86 domain-containing protein [Candidatus Lokiarchaeota archaeon]
MDDLREKRYNDKINYITSSIQLFSTIPKNELEKRGIFYTIQTSIESLIDLIAMVVKDLGIPVNDDEKNISELINRRKIDPELGEDLKKANGMRNILVHRYNSIEEETIFESENKLKKLFLEWLKIIEEILNELTDT